MWCTSSLVGKYMTVILEYICVCVYLCIPCSYRHAGCMCLSVSNVNTIKEQSWARCSKSLTAFWVKLISSKSLSKIFLIPNICYKMAASWSSCTVLTSYHLQPTLPQSPKFEMTISNYCYEKWNYIIIPDVIKTWILANTICPQIKCNTWKK